MSLQTLFDKEGPVKFIQSDGDIDVEAVSGEGKVLGLYFSAHWCPPCRAFTPQLAEWYKKFKDTPNGKNFDIVFVSSDRDQKSFNEYFKEMPWLALPYEKRDVKASLSKKFKVSGIPTLVMLDGKTGNMITTDGRAIVMEDPEGKEFPWTPKTFAEIIPGELVNKEGKKVDLDQVEADVIGLYFSAHWCGPCRAFTPQLVKSYDKIKKDGKKFEIIFVSSDRDQDAMSEYLNEMPWLAIPFGDKRKKSLSQKFEISGIPSFIIVQKDGTVITTQGRGALSQDPDGKEFPWYPKPVNSLTGATAGAVNDSPSLIWFTSKNDTVETVKNILTPIAEKWIKDSKEGKVEEVKFFYHSEDEDDEDDIGSSLKSFANIGNDTLALIDIPNQQVYCHKGEVTAEVISKILSDYTASTLEMNPLRS